MNKLIKSQFSNNTIFWGIIILFFTICNVKLLFQSIINYKFGFAESLLFLLFLLILILSINHLKQVKLLIIEEKNIKYYSIISPFKKIINLSNYIGKLTLTETGASGSYKVIYLINQNNEATFKIMGLHYKNFKQIEDAIPLKEMNYKLTSSEYFTLLFFQTLKLKTNKADLQNDSLNFILKLLKRLFLVGLLLFLSTTVVKLIIVVLA